MLGIMCSHDDAQQTAARRPSARRRSVLAVAATFALAASSLALTPAYAADEPDATPSVSPAAAPPVSIDVVTINDFHGRIEADRASAGAAVLAGAVQEFRAANPNTVFAAAGDLIGASTFTSFIDSDNPTIDALNAAGLEVSAAGNHEFDQGWEDLRDRVVPRADWKYISANVLLKDTQRPALAPSWVTEFEGVRIGFIGAVTEDLDTLVAPAGIADIEIANIVASVNQTADELRDGDPNNGEADVIVLLVHEGAATVDAASITPDSPLGEIVYGVDAGVNAIVSAHTHLAYNHVIDGRPVVSAGQYGENVGLMNIQVDRASKQLISISNQIKPLTSGGTAFYPAVGAVQDIVDAAAAQADILGAIRVGEVTGDFNRALQADGTTENRGGESTIGNFVADVHKWSTGADIAMINPGGIREDISFASSAAADPDGTVTYREVATVQPFANTLVTMTFTGEQVKAVLEQQWQPAGSSRPFLKLGVSKELSYTYNPTAPQGERVTTLLLNGAPVDPSVTYTVAANGFLAGGGDNFTTFADGANRKDSGMIDLQSMVDWFEANEVATPDLVQRAVGAVLSAADSDGYTAGDEVTLSLSSLAFSAGEPAPGTVTVSLAGTELAAGQVDSTVVTATDEGGRANLVFTVPPGVLGAQVLDVAVAGTGTTAQIPITISEAPAPEPVVSLSASSVVAGTSLTVTGSGFEPGDELILELRSSPVRLGTATVRADGTVTAVVTVPANTAAGAHTLAVILPSGDEVTAPVTVTAASNGGSGSDGAAGGTGAGDLATTGAEVGPYPALAALLLMAGLALVLARRRSRVS